MTSVVIIFTGNFEIGPRVPSSLTSSQATPFPSMYASNQASQARGNLPTMVQYPSRANIPLNLQKQVNYKLGARNSLRPNQTSFHPRHPLNTIGTASGTHDLQNKAQPTTSGQSSIVIGSPISSEYLVILLPILLLFISCDNIDNNYLSGKNLKYS